MAGCNQIYADRFWYRHDNLLSVFCTQLTLAVCGGEGSGVNFLLSDHLGSVTVAVYAGTGQLQSYRLYTAWGEEYASYNNIPTGYQYTSQRWDAGLGLYDYQARYYDPALGKFISADTLIPDPASPQSFNRYAYVRNSPLLRLDPTGHDDLILSGEVTPEELQDLLNGLANASDILENISSQIRLGGTLDSLVDLLGTLGVTVTTISTIGLAAKLTDPQFVAALIGGITGWITSVTGIMSPGALALGLVIPVLLVVGVSALIGAAGAYMIVDNLLSQAMNQFDSIRSELSDISSNTFDKLDIRITEGRWGGYDYNFTALNSNGSIITSRYVFLSWSPLQWFGLSVTDSIGQVWPNVVQSSLYAN